MKSSLGTLALVHAVLWITVNVGWLEVGGEQLTGSQLNNALNLLPAISLIMLLISAYRRFQRSLWVASGLSSGFVSVVVFLSDFSKSPAVVSVLEAMTGIQDAVPSDAGISLVLGPAAWIASGLSLSALGASVYFAIRKPIQSVVQKQEQSADNRSLWDEQQ
jgi:hypothetical protein